MSECDYKDKGQPLRSTIISVCGIWASLENWFLPAKLNGFNKKKNIATKRPKI